MGHGASLRGHEEAHSSKWEVDGDGIRDSNRKQIDINRDSSWRLESELSSRSDGLCQNKTFGLNKTSW